MRDALGTLLQFALANELTEPEDYHYVRNMLLFALMRGEPDAYAADGALPKTATPMLDALCDEAVEKGLLVDEPFERDQFSTHLMNLLTPPPSRVIERFARICSEHGVVAATDWFYALCRANGYIRVEEIAKSVRFSAPSPYGVLDITINLSKPEKDPREIAKAVKTPKSGYPACMLCVENEGYPGRPGYPSHETLRMIPLDLCGDTWLIQYSPYSYYDEHCIALRREHVPMETSPGTFARLLALVDMFPHYFFGSNADLPIVGGSILNHDHFQGGKQVFPMEKSPAYASFNNKKYPGVSVQAVRWPMTCIRLTARDKEPMIGLASDLLAAWRRYDDPSYHIFSNTGGVPHNAITPIARRTEDGRYILHLVLRNNRTSDEHPLGIFHPHANLHHIKRENIGLIEVMGLFILPGRLRAELAAAAECLTGLRSLDEPAEDDPLHKHFPWVESLARVHGAMLRPNDAARVLNEALCDKCVQVLEDAGVYKPYAGDAGLAAFMRGVCS